MSKRVAIIGDIGGHVSVLHKALAQLGVNPVSLVIPDGLSIVQVGDLARLREEQTFASDECVALADKMLLANPARWIQLFGNHEAAALGGPRMAGWGNAELSPRSLAILQSWWQNGRSQLSVGVRVDGREEYLVTHAGLTRGKWIELGSPNLSHAVRLINADVEQDVPEVLRAGKLVYGEVTPSPSVVWAEVNAEMYMPWLRSHVIPFHQIHGHASPWRWATNEWWPDTPPAVRDACLVDCENHREVTTLGQLPNGKAATAIGVDWGLEATAPETIWPILMLENATIIQ